ncbi:hypothetical protein E2K99_10335 [Herbaspirillum huttiense]|uniref:hypothetical protein n=1 Tax=Herbaspirillum huttiense TaxID=863372 RepID=UPI001064EFFD|nr:hypothetical protein [Herbaspirillum huttiense]QBP75384.1 hypothetical protein E2K99_10335 [Herbaspirillum huttiense]
MEQVLKISVEKQSDDTVKLTLDPLANGGELAVQYIDQAIAALGKLREGLAPPIGENRPLGVLERGLTDPAFHVSPQDLQGGALLQIRDPGFGWMNFAFSHQNSLLLSQLLQKFSADPAAQSPSH